MLKRRRLYRIYIPGTLEGHLRILLVTLAQKWILEEQLIGKLFMKKFSKKKTAKKWGSG